MSDIIRKKRTPPSPEKSVGGIGSAPLSGVVRTPVKTPNWNGLWRHKLEVEAWQACALSVNINPNSMQPERRWSFGNGPYFGEENFPNSATKVLYEERLMLLTEHLSKGLSFSPNRLNMGKLPKLQEVKLAEFAAWCLFLKLENLPPELKSMASLKEPQMEQERLADSGTLKVLNDVPAEKGINKQDVIAAFGSLVSINLESVLADGKGLFGDEQARTRKGTPGGRHSALWDPVILAIGLNEKYNVPMLHLKNAFFKHPFLSKWLDKWKDELERSGL